MEAKVLIVEDEPIVAFEIENILQEAGFEIVGCVGSLNKALATLKDTDCDIAVLDANLRGDSAAPMAMALRERGRPFLFVSGFERANLPAAFLDEPLLAKPFEPGELVAAVTRLLSGVHTREDYSRSRCQSH
jgi:DNA-binding response OmpR family regulator